MTTFAFIAVIASALFHSSYNLMIKSSDEKTLFMWSIFFVAVAIAWITGLTIYPGLPESFLRVFVLAAISALFFTLYHLCAARAYASEEGDLSLSYPITTLAPIFIPVWAFALLGDTFTVTKVGGILISTVGTFCIQLKRSPGHGRFRSVGLRSEAVRFALLASFLYSFGAISDKVGVSQGGFYSFTVCLMTMIFAYFTFVVFYSPRLRKMAFHCFRQDSRKVFAGGALLFFSNVSYRYALEITDVSYAAGVRQSASLFAVLMGIFLLREPYGLQRFFASLLIALGIALIKIG
jgi:drug/metabolite transporter (DMT)-like permease